MTEDNTAGPAVNQYYIGDWPIPDYSPPPFAPYQPPYTWPPLSPVPLPWEKRSTTTTLTPPRKEDKKENKVDVYIIWAITPDQPNAPWAVSVWDAESRAENEDGWLEDLAKAEETYGGRFIRVTRSTVNYDAVIAAFGEQEV